MVAAACPLAAVAERQLIDRNARGKLAESAAREVLLKAGLREIARNVSYRGGELDLVVLDASGRDGATLVFVEVRYRKSQTFGGGAASVDIGKRRKLVHAAQLFLAEHREYAHAACRFDVVDAEGDPQAPRITWLRDAFRADDV